jgi:hypothetical protein
VIPLAAFVAILAATVAAATAFALRHREAWA